MIEDHDPGDEDRTPIDDDPIQKKVLRALAVEAKAAERAQMASVCWLLLSAATDKRAARAAIAKGMGVAASTVTKMANEHAFKLGQRVDTAHRFMSEDSPSDRRLRNQRALSPPPDRNCSYRSAFEPPLERHDVRKPAMRSRRFGTLR